MRARNSVPSRSSGQLYSVMAVPVLFLIWVGYSVRAAASFADEESKEPKTIGDVVSVAGLQSYPVQGVGLVAGLDGTGCDPVPSPSRSTLLEDMQKRGVKNAEEVLRSPNTALVRIHARIPPAVRSCKSAGCWCKLDKKTKRSDSDEPLLRPHKGDTFDVELEIPNQDTATSLKGGWLLEAWLFEVAAIPGAGTIAGHVHAKAEGPVLVTGGLDGQEPNPADLRRGRVLGGGIANDDRDFALITQSDRTARWTIQIAARISDRFHAKTRDGKPVAEPKDGQRVLLKIPPRYRQNIARYLEVLKYMPLTQTGAQESERMMRYAADLMDPAKARLAALRLEGIGHRAAEALKRGLESPDPDVRFFAAEALAYLDEPKGGEELAAAAREIPEYRAHALTALSSLDEPISVKVLHDLLGDSQSVELRYGAFRALRALDPDDAIISGEAVGDQLFLHHVKSAGTPFVHITSRERPEVVLFGRDVRLQTPLLLKAGKIIVSASEGSPQVQLIRIEPGREEQRQLCELDLRDIVRAAVRMGATYPDVAAMLIQADRQSNLPGRLEIDSLPDPTRLVARIQHIGSAAAKTNENVAMPNLFRANETRKPTDRASAEDSDEIATANSDDESKMRKPSLWDRLLRRSAN